MKMSEDKERIISFKDKIVASHLFASSKRYVLLLEFLVDKALKGEHLKEYVIGVELYKKNYSSDGNDSIVRVNMYNLRKKLGEYYKTEGKDDSIKFTFDRRSYNLKFVERTTNNGRAISVSKIGGKLQQLHIIIIAAIAIIIASTFIYNFMQPNYFWNYFISTNTPTKVIIADHLMLDTKIDGVNVALGHPSIITKQDFDKHIKENKIDSLSVKDFTFYTKSIPYAVQRLERLFCKNNHDFTQISEIDFKYDDTKNANIIYVGQPKTMKTSKLLFLSNSKVFEYKDNVYYYTDEEGKRHEYINNFNPNGAQMEYGMISYSPLESGNKALYFVSNNDIGIMATLDDFMDEKFLKRLYKEMGEDDTYFNILYRVNGIDRVDIEYEIIHIEVISN